MRSLTPASASRLARWSAGPLLAGPMLAVLALAGPGTAQSNAIPGRDLRIIGAWQLLQFRRVGVYPDGFGGMGALTTCCNPGNAPIPFEPVMSPNHAYIFCMVCRLSDDRLVQISTRGYVKHTEGSGNVASPCGACAGPGSTTQLEVGCADSYANFQAVDHYNLGPPDEIDPWLGIWVPECSKFDRGDPPVSPSQLCDGVRSLDRAQADALNATVNHEMRVYDADLVVPGTFWYQGGYLCPGEPEAVRDDNLGSRACTPAWDGTAWSFADGPDFQSGTVLNRWPGATITSNTNGADDGRCYVAAKVTDSGIGLWHYEYAIHNRDNKRGIGRFRVPVCPAARVQDFGFHDVDRDENNGWMMSRYGGEITFQTMSNPLRWNTIFNFWFDSDAAPVPGNTLSLDQFDIGPGALTIAVPGPAPTGLFNVSLGPGCGVPFPPTLYPVGSPPNAVLGNASFALESSGNPVGALCAFFVCGVPGATAIGEGCTVYVGIPNTLIGPYYSISDSEGIGIIPVPIPNQPAFEGRVVDFQGIVLGPPGALFGIFNFTPGLRVRVGSLLSGCP